MNDNQHHLTKTGERILEILQNSDIPLTVYQISDRTKIPVPSVYRNVAVLQDQELVSEFQIRGIGYYYARQRHSHYFICKSCGNIVPLQSCEILNSEVEKSIDCKVTEHIVIYQGFCKSCLEKEQKR
ncbi:MAG TPA: transcriptional repressor [Pseudothermotoga sp.]|nr:transcriptional repressor [Pseudothermotoga sp.]